MSKTYTVPSTTYKHFDLPDLIENIPQEYLRMQVAQSYAWRVDTMLVQAVRTLFKTVRDDARTSELDTAADLNNALAETAFAEACFEDIGSDSWGPVQAIHELLDLRPRAHTIAREATSGVLDWKGQVRNYIEPNLSDIFHAQGTMKPKGETLVKMKMNANRRAAAVATGKDAIEMAQKLYDRKVAKEKNRLASMGEALKAQAGALETMFNIAVARRPARMPVHLDFHQINLEAQRLLIANTISACERAENWAESDSNISPSENDDICLTSDLTIRELKKVLVSPKFNSGVNGNAEDSPILRTVVAPTAPTTPKPQPAKPTKLVKLSDLTKTEKVKAAPKPRKAKDQPQTIKALDDLKELKDLVTTQNDL